MFVLYIGKNWVKLPTTKYSYISRWSSKRQCINLLYWAPLTAPDINRRF